MPEGESRVEQIEKERPVCIDPLVKNSESLIKGYLGRDEDEEAIKVLLFAHLPDGSRFSGPGDGELRVVSRSGLEIKEGGEWRYFDTLPFEGVRRYLILDEPSIRAITDYYVRQVEEDKELYVRRLNAEELRARRHESAVEPFGYDKKEAEFLGLEELKIKGDDHAQDIIEQIMSGGGDKDIEDFFREWGKKCPDIAFPCVLKNRDGEIITELPDPKDRPDDGADEAIVSAYYRNYADYSQSRIWYFRDWLPYQRIIENLTGIPRVAIPGFNQNEVVLVDSWEEAKPKDRAQKHVSALIKELRGNDSVENISRPELDAALWQGDPGDRVPTEKHKEILARLKLDPNEFEIRPIRQDEYARVATEKGWGQQNFWVLFDHYQFEEGRGVGGGDFKGRSNLVGGHCGAGGSSSVFVSRYNEPINAVRLVIARRPV